MVAEDLRYYLEHGFDGVYFDSNGWDNEAKFGDSGVQWMRSNTFDASAMEMWVTSRLMWDPSQAPEAMRDEICRRAYHAAAPEMRQFYRMYRRGWTVNRSFLAWNAGAPACIDKYIHLFDNGKKATDLFEAALKTR